MPQIPGATSAGLVLSQTGALPDDSMGQSLNPLQLHCSLGSSRICPAQATASRQATKIDAIIFIPLFQLNINQREQCGSTQPKKMLQSLVLFDDKDVKIRQQCVTIKTYYFPFGTSKRISIADIHQVLLIKQSSGRIWGTGTFQFWFACDSKRFDYDCFIALDTGSGIKPAFTCTDNQRVYQLLSELVLKSKLQRSTRDI